MKGGIRGGEAGSGIVNVIQLVAYVYFKFFIIATLNVIAVSEFEMLLKYVNMDAYSDLSTILL
jgi:hypothetical protein